MHVAMSSTSPDEDLELPMAWNYFRAIPFPSRPANFYDNGALLVAADRINNHEENAHARNLHSDNMSVCRSIIVVVIMVMGFAPLSAKRKRGREDPIVVVVVQWRFRSLQRLSNSRPKLYSVGWASGRLCSLLRLESARNNKP